MSSQTDTKYYLIRTLAEHIEKDVVGVGWSVHNFEQLGTADEAIQNIDEDYGIRRWSNQIRRFYEIREGDIVVAPLPYRVAIGKAVGGLFFDQIYYDKNRANQRRVKFPKDKEENLFAFPRDSFSEAFQRRLRVQGMTVNDFGEFADEIQEALSTFEGSLEIYSWTNKIAAEKEKQEAIFKKKLLECIQLGQTTLQTGEVGLEKVVEELLIIEGYQTRPLSKRQFKDDADADVEASRSDKFITVRLLIQVKHHYGESNDNGICQLEKIKSSHQGEYDDYKFILVTSAFASRELFEKAVKAGVILIDGLGLADWIAEHIEKLKPETKLSLGIYKVSAIMTRSSQ